MKKTLDKSQPAPKKATLDRSQPFVRRMINRFIRRIQWRIVFFIARKLKDMWKG